MRVTCNWLRHPSSTLLTLGLLLFALPLLSRYLLGWSHTYGYLSDLAIGSLLVIILIFLQVTGTSSLIVHRTSF